MEAIWWYMNLYYKYRDYPVKEVNSQYKKSELRAVYTSIFTKLSSYFTMEPYITNPHQTTTQSFLQSRKSIRSTGMSHFKKMESHGKKSHSDILSSNKCKSIASKNQILDDQNSQSAYEKQPSFVKINQSLINHDLSAESERNNLQYLINCSLSQILLAAHRQRRKNLELNNSQELDSNMSTLYHTKMDIKSQKKLESKEQLAEAPLEQNIALQSLPVSNNEIKMYFLDFCANIEVCNDWREGQLNITDLESENIFSEKQTDNLAGPDSSRLTVSNNKKSAEKKNQTQLLSKILIRNVQNVKQGQKISEDFQMILLQLYTNEIANLDSYLESYQTYERNENNMELFMANTKQWDFNLFIQIWLEFLFMLNQSNTTYFQLIEGLISNNKNGFVDQISTYLYYITFIKTKKLMFSIISKINLLCYISEICESRRNLADLKIEEQSGILHTWDNLIAKQIYFDETLKIFKSRVKQLGRIVSEELACNSELFWGKALYDCLKILDIQYNEKISFGYSVVKLCDVACSLNQNFNLSQSSQSSSINTGANIKCIYQLLKQDYNLRPQVHGYKCKHKGESMPDFQSNTYEIKEWSKNMNLIINKSKEYNMIIDEGFEIFNGNSEAIIHFFLSIQRNIRAIECVVTIDRYWCIYGYCKSVRQRVSKLNQIKKDNRQVRYAISQLENNVGNYEESLKIFKQYKKYHSQRVKQERQSEKMDIDLQPKSQNSFSQSFHNLYQEQHHDLLPKIYSSQFIAHFIATVKSQDYLSTHVSSVDGSNLKMLRQINKYMQLVNVCNLISISANQFVKLKKWTDKDWENSREVSRKTLNLSFKELPKSNTILMAQQMDQSQNYGQFFIFLTGEQLYRELQSLKNEGKSQLQNKRSINKNIVSSKNSVNFNNELVVSMGRPKQQTQLNTQNVTQLDKYPTQKSLFSSSDFDKIIEKFQNHIKCLQLVLLLYAKSSDYYQEQCKSKSNTQPLSNSTYPSKLHQLVGKQQFDTLHQHNYSKQLSIFEFKHWVRRYRLVWKNRLATDFEKTTEIQNYYTKLMEIYQTKKQILCAYSLRASLEVSSETFKNIDKYQLLSKEKFEKLKVIGKKYYHRLFNLVNEGNQSFKVAQGETEVFSNTKLQSDEETLYLEHYKQTYRQNLLLVIISTIQLIYNTDEQSLPSISQYITLLTQYFSTKTYKIDDMYQRKKNEQLINFGRCMEEVFDWNTFIENEEIDEAQFLQKLTKIRINQSNEELLDKFYAIMKELEHLLQKMPTHKNKVQFLEGKLFYLMMRQIYFFEYYDKMAFESKPKQAKKNYQLYQEKMVDFFAQIHEKDLEEYAYKRKQELKQRSKFLQGYLSNYQHEPPYLDEQKSQFRKIICLFDKTLSLITQSKKLEMKKRSNYSLTLLNRSFNQKQPLYMHYVSKQYIKPNSDHVKVFDMDNYHFYQAIRIYESFLQKNEAEGQRRCSFVGDHKLNGAHISESLSQDELRILTKNKQSLVSLWANEQCCAVYEKQVGLAQKAFLLKIQKLYVELDVRHKVFQSFKDKILNYEMQKAKIYHQYLDYIKGLKLDVYSHIAQEDPLPYFKLLNAIKLFRLNVKKKELQDKVNQQFGKNLGKWNNGIMVDLNKYIQWVDRQKQVWSQKNEQSKKTKKELEQISQIIVKDLQRQQNHNHEVNMNFQKKTHTSKFSRKSNKNIYNTTNSSYVKKQKKQNKSPSNTVSYTPQRQSMLAPLKFPKFK